MLIVGHGRDPLLAALKSACTAHCTICHAAWHYFGMLPMTSGGGSRTRKRWMRWS